jgi:hypothetical protein
MPKTRSRFIHYLQILQNYFYYQITYQKPFCANPSSSEQKQYRYKSSATEHIHSGLLLILRELPNGKQLKCNIAYKWRGKT